MGECGVCGQSTGCAELADSRPARAALRSRSRATRTRAGIADPTARLFNQLALLSQCKGALCRSRVWVLAWGRGMSHSQGDEARFGGPVRLTGRVSNPWLRRRSRARGSNSTVSLVRSGSNGIAERR